MPTPVQQIAPGILHWSNPHPNHGGEVSGYLLTESRVMFDPIEPPDGIEWFADNDLEPRAILLSCRHHRRHSREIAERYGCRIHAVRAGMHEFDVSEGVVPFDFGDTLEGGVEAREIDAIAPDETAFVVPEARAVVVADGVVNFDRLGFVPDGLMGDDPEGVKRGLTAAFSRLVEEVDFDHLLCAHGEPVIATGRAELREFVGAMA